MAVNFYFLVKLQVGDKLLIKSECYKQVVVFYFITTAGEKLL